MWVIDDEPFLRRCPFCGSDDLDDERIDAIVCTNCGATGPDAKYEDPAEARALWNRRT